MSKPFTWLDLRKHYYNVSDIPLCNCGGCWHYDKELKGFVCEECGKPVPVIDITRNTRPYLVHRTCKECGKQLKGKQRDFCSDNCRMNYNNHKTIYTEDVTLNKYKYMLDDYNTRFTDSEYTQNDNNWDLGESNLLEHRSTNHDRESFYINQELKRIKGRPVNP